MRHAVCLLALIACKAEPVDTDVSKGLLGQGLMDVFPNAMLVDEAGHLALPVDALPPSPSPLPVERLAWRTGFSPAQPSVVRMVDVNADVLPTWHDPRPGQSVLLIDLDTGEQLPVMAELDAYPDGNPEPVLIVRPQAAMPAGHRVAVVVTTDAAARPGRFDALLAGEAPSGFGGGVAHWQALVAELEGHGIAADDIALTWDFPVAAGTDPLTAALGQLGTEHTATITRLRTSEDANLAPGAWKVAQGTFSTTDFLVDDRLLALDDAGMPTVTGTRDAELYVHIPESVKDAEAGSVPVLIYGHGIFAEPEVSLDTTFEYGPIWLANELGVIVVATRWRGLDYNDLPGALEVANDIGKFPLITDRLIQGQSNTRALAEWIAAGGLFDHPDLRGESDQVLADPDILLFQGESMGGIEGAVLIAQGAPVQAGLLHITGSTWSTMLERSNNWPTFELIVTQSVPDPRDRQLHYAISQLFWDAVDPIAYAPQLSDAVILIQENRGDDAVSNIGTRSLARSIDLPLLAPYVEEVYGIDSVEGPLPAGSRALVQLDPELEMPDDHNRPAGQIGSHFATATWPGTLKQMGDFLDPDAPGTVVHHCGAEACSASNRGSWAD